MSNKIFTYIWLYSYDYGEYILAGLGLVWSDREKDAYQTGRRDWQQNAPVFWDSKYIFGDRKTRNGTEADFFMRCANIKSCDYEEA